MRWSKAPTLCGGIVVIMGSIDPLEGECPRFVVNGLDVSATSAPPRLRVNRSSFPSSATDYTEPARSTLKSAVLH